MKIWDFIKGLKAPIYFTSISPVLIGWAFSNFRFSYLVLLLLVVTISMQAGMNLAMDYFDHSNSRPLRNDDTVYPLGSYFIEKLGVRPKTIRYGFLAMMTLAVVVGLLVVYLTRSILLLTLGLTAVFLSLLYVVPPIKLGARGIGEIATFFSFGPFPVLGTIIALGYSVGLDAILVSLSLGLLASSIRYLHHLPEDREGGRRVRMFKIVYPIMIITASIMISVERSFEIASIVVFVASLIHVAFLPRSAIKIARQTNYSVALHFLFTVAVVVTLLLVAG
ncbi:MAG: prenyltransferase [Candidatus Thermoplasmatota archaeon]|nr:prenyltransferase [Candidatus Thermoplasmatota archaeon]